MKFKFLILVSMISHFSCSTFQSRKTIGESSVSFYGGVYEDQEWNDELEFDRVSWFNDATMKFDLLVTKLDKGSPYLNWLGESKAKLQACPHFYVVMLYSVDQSEALSYLRKGMAQASLSNNELILPSFTQELQSHPNFDDWQLKHHSLYGFCLKNKMQLTMRIPGFKSKKLP